MAGMQQQQQWVAGVGEVPREWRWWQVVTQVHLSPLRPFPFAAFARAPLPLSDEEFLHWAATAHAVKQGLTFGLPLVLIFFAELCILFMVSLPFDDEATTFAYEVQYDNIWLAQLFDQLYEAQPYGKEARPAAVLNVTPHVNRSIPLQQLSETLHGELPLRLHLVGQHVGRLAGEGRLGAEGVRQAEELRARMAGHAGLVLYRGRGEEEVARLLQCDVRHLRQARASQPPPPLHAWGHGSHYGKGRSLVQDRTPGLLLHHMRCLEQLATQLQALLAASLQDAGLHAACELSRVAHTSHLFAAAAHNQTLGTLFLSQVRDVGQRLLTSAFSTPDGELVGLFRERPWFDFQFSIYGVFILAFYLFFRCEHFRYPHRSRLAHSTAMRRQPGWLRVRVRSLTPLVVLLTHFTVSLGLLRMVRVLTYSGTLLPPNRVWCKPHRFRGTDKFGRLLTMGSPFLERLAIVLYYVASTYGQKVGGGCADLIYSGHVTIYVLAVVIFHVYSPHWWATAVMYLLFLEPTLHAIIKGHHYTVDCVVAVYMSFLVAYFVQNSILPRVFGEDIMAETYRLKTLTAKDRRGGFALPA